MSERATPWDSANKAYLAHHFRCRQCISAGSAPGTQARCPVGQALWETYNQAGAPPHFTWLPKRKHSYE